MRTTIVTPNLHLRVPEESDAEAIRSHHERNAQHLLQFSPTPPPDYVSLEGTLRRIRAARTALHEDRSFRFYVFSARTAEVIGAAALSEIVRGPFQAAYLGYHIDVDYEGRGYMTEALRALVDFAFTDLGLHRIMANYVPWNRRSGRVLERLGFAVEGYAKAYLLINGTWEDHVLTSLSNSSWSAPRPGP